MAAEALIIVGDIPADTPRKPLMFDLCNGCGLCCVAGACSLALDHVAGAAADETCPALEWDLGRAWCGLVRRPLHYVPGLADDLPESKRGMANAIIGDIIRDALGDGVCDSGPPPPFDGPDVYAGLNALEFIAAGRGQ